MSFSKRIAALSMLVLAAGAALAEFDGPAPVAWRWAEPTSASPSGAPIVDGERVYAAVGGRIYAVDPATGNQIWRYPVGVPIEGNFQTGLVKSGNVIVAASTDRNIFAVNANTGELIWQYMSPDSVVGTPVITTTTVVMPLATDALLALSLADGNAIWAEPKRYTDGLNREMAAWQDNVIFSTRSGEMKMMDMAAQRERWSLRFGRVNAGSGPVVQGDNIYVNTSSYIYCLTALNGRQRWRATVRDLTVYSPAVSEQGVAAVTQRGELYAFDLNGRPRFQPGVDLKSGPVAGPAFAGKLVTVPTSNGAINAVNPLTGELVWTYVVPPLTAGMTAAPASTGSTTGGGGDFGGGGMTPPGGGGQDSQATVIKYVLSAGPTASMGDSLFLLAMDGSMLAFDKKNGVDLTPPTAQLLWPNAGDQISGQAPLQMVFQLKDLGSGINPDTVSFSINGQPMTVNFDRDGYLWFTVSSTGPNRPLRNGRATLVVSATDWMGNTMTANYALTIDNTLPALGGPPSSTTTSSGDGNRVGGGGASFGGG